MEAIEIQKDLMKTKVMANFDRFENGSLYYNVDVLGATYQFPIHTIEKAPAVGLHTTEGFMIDDYKLQAVDVKGAAFTTSMRGSELFRWIKKAYNNNEFIKISA